MTPMSEKDKVRQELLEAINTARYSVGGIPDSFLVVVEAQRDENIESMSLTESLLIGHLLDSIMYWRERAEKLEVILGK